MENFAGIGMKQVAGLRWGRPPRPHGHLQSHHDTCLVSALMWSIGPLLCHRISFVCTYELQPPLFLIWLRHSMLHAPSYHCMLATSLTSIIRCVAVTCTKLLTSIGTLSPPESKLLFKTRENDQVPWNLLFYVNFDFGCDLHLTLTSKILIQQSRYQS